jgi:hypothetical protein
MARRPPRHRRGTTRHCPCPSSVRSRRSSRPRCRRRRREFVTEVRPPQRTPSRHRKAHAIRPCGFDSIVASRRRPVAPPCPRRGGEQARSRLRCRAECSTKHPGLLLLRVGPGVGRPLEPGRIGWNRMSTSPRRNTAEQPAGTGIPPS